MTLTARQRVQRILEADFFVSDTGRIATRQDILDALPSGPALDRYIPAPVSLPVLPETWRAS